MGNRSKSDTAAQNAILAIKGSRSYRATAKDLERASGRDVNPGFLCAIVNGNRHAVGWLLRALEIAPSKYPPHPVTRLSRLTNRERAKREFEEWALDVFDLTPTRDPQDDYLDSETELLWMCWLDSRMVAAAVSVDAGRV